tara:strand:+ start:37639 stop:38802 length:1164 start_codon:yes stop_codon:yes gene_type:complete
MITKIDLLVDRKWPIFPCLPGEKKPAVKTGFKAATTASATIEKWWTDCPDYNVGLVTGKSSGIVAIDIDPRNGGDATLTNLIDKNGDLPKTVQVATGGGGFHFYFKHPGGKIKCRNNALGQGIDVKADGGYVIAPPSKLKSGGSYDWIVSPDDFEPACLPAWLLALLTQKDTEDTEDTDISVFTGSTEHTVLSGDTITTVSTVSIDYTYTIQEAIETTLPQASGQRNKRLFDFARALKAVPEFKDKPLRELKPFVLEWHRLGKPQMSGEHDADSTWAEFCTIWTAVKFPLGQGPLAEFMSLADAEPDPVCTAEYGERTTRLIKLCRVLQQHSGNRPFFLSARAVSPLLGTNRTDAANQLKMLCVDGILERKTKGHTGVASEYIYLGD